MSSATRTRAGSTALIALLCFCSPLLAAQGDDVTPEQAEQRAFATEDPAELHHWLKIAADGGRRDAQAILGERYVRGTPPGGKDLAGGIELLRRAAAQGSSQAQSMLGWVYWSGIGVKQDDGQAVKWLTAAARQEEGYALASLSRFYYYGTVVARDEQRGRRLLLRAAELGDRRGLDGAWRMLLLGAPEDRNTPLGLHFLNRAAGRDDADAAYALAREYLTGRDVPRDAARAAQWFERAAKTKHVLAALWLSELHAKGLGVQKDVKRAEEMLQTALSTAEIADKNNFAWSLAVQEDAQLRNSALAVRVLEPALAAEKEKSPGHLDTLAAVYADLGRFDKAVATQVEALEGWRRKWPKRSASAIEERLELYRAGKAYREDSL